MPKKYMRPNFEGLNEEYLKYVIRKKLPWDRDVTEYFYDLFYNCIMYCKAEIWVELAEVKPFSDIVTIEQTPTSTRFIKVNDVEIGRYDDHRPYNLQNFQFYDQAREKMLVHGAKKDPQFWSVMHMLSYDVSKDALKSLMSEPYSAKDCDWPLQLRAYFHEGKDYLLPTTPYAPGELCARANQYRAKWALYLYFDPEKQDLINLKSVAPDLKAIFKNLDKLKSHLQPEQVKDFSESKFANMPYEELDDCGVNVFRGLSVNDQMDFMSGYVNAIYEQKLSEKQFAIYEKLLRESEQSISRLDLLDMLKEEGYANGRLSLKEDGPDVPDSKYLLRAFFARYIRYSRDT